VQARRQRPHERPGDAPDEDAGATIVAIPLGLQEELAMKRAIPLWVVLLVFGITAQAQPPSPTGPVERGPTVRPLSEHVARPDDPLDSRVLERLPRPSTEARPGIDATVRRPGAGAASAARPPAATTLNLPALRDRVGGITDVRVVREDRSVEAPPASSRTVTLRRGDVLAVRRDEPVQPVISPDGTLTAPSSTILYAVDAAGRTRELGIIHETAGLFWQPDRSRFAGELLVGVVDREDPRASGPLGATVPVQLLAAPGAVDPALRELTRIGLPLRRVTVAVADPEDPFPIELVSQIDLDLPNAALAVRRPRLSIAAPDRIQGLGVGDAVVTVSAGASGTTLPRGAKIALALDNGWLADRTLVVGDDGTATTRIRSDWVGRGTLRVVTPPYEATPREIDYTTPVRFLAATALGAMLGAFVLVHMLGRSEPAARRSGARDWIVGVAVGVGATTMRGGRHRADPFDHRHGRPPRTLTGVTNARWTAPPGASLILASRVREGPAALIARGCAATVRSWTGRAARAAVAPDRCRRSPAVTRVRRRP
jgi:hypothetical protein